MKNTPTIIVLLLGAVALFGALYFYACRYKDIDKISGYSAMPGLPADELPHDDSILSSVLKPAAQYHQKRLAEQSADLLLGIWVLDDFAEFGSLVPKTIEFQRISENRVSVNPGITSDNEQISEFLITRWVSPDFPTAIHTGTTVSIYMFNDDEIGVQPREMDPFGLGARYTRQK